VDFREATSYLREADDGEELAIQDPKFGNLGTSNVGESAFPATWTLEKVEQRTLVGRCTLENKLHFQMVTGSAPRRLMVETGTVLASSAFTNETRREAFRSPLLKKAMPGLDSLRGLAILSVLFYHGLHADTAEDLPAHSASAHVVSNLLGSGWLGVFLFFILSGFLITGILLDSKGRPDYWRRFYSRRVLRIMPAFALVLLTLKLFFGSSWTYIAACLAYIANLAPALHLEGYIYGPLWSLAVEEQFYLCWPWLVKWLSKRHLAYAAITCIFLSPLLRFLSVVGIVSLGDPHRMTWLLSDSLAMGALIAILLRSKWGEPKSARMLVAGLLALGVVVLVIGMPFHILHWDSPLGATLKTVPFELMFAALLLISLFVGDHPRVLVLTRPLRFFGYISYGLYLCHLMVFQIIDRLIGGPEVYRHWNGAEWYLRFIAGSAFSVLVAFLSRRYFEEFFLRMGRSRVAG
jgi:peptidoglycan/LPS O-acetylase OafA/YrhL